MKYMVDVKGELPKSGALAKAERLNIRGLLDKLAEEICDHYCKYPDICGPDEDAIYTHCNDCPIVELL